MPSEFGSWPYKAVCTELSRMVVLILSEQHHIPQIDRMGHSSLLDYTHTRSHAQLLPFRVNNQDWLRRLLEGQLCHRTRRFTFLLK